MKESWLPTLRILTPCGTKPCRSSDTDACAAARDVLRRTLPGRENASVRRQITRRLWAGTILPSDVLTACGWGDEQVEKDPDSVLRAALHRALLTDPHGPVQPLNGHASDPLTDTVSGPAHTLSPTPVDWPSGPLHTPPVDRPTEPVHALSPQVTAVGQSTRRGKVPVSPEAVSKVLKAVRSGQPMGKSAIVTASGLKQSTATRAVTHLVECGQLTTIGSATRPEYVLTSGALVATPEM